MPDAKAAKEPEPKSHIGVIFLLCVLGFSLAVWLDLGGVGTKLGKLMNLPLTRAAPSPQANQPGVSPLAIPDPPVTQAWFVDASGYEGAEAERRSTKAAMLIYFYKRGCEACRRLEHDLLALPDVKLALAPDVKVRVDISGDREARLLPRFGLSPADIPALIWIGPDGNSRPIPLHPNGSPITAAQLIAAAR